MHTVEDEGLVTSFSKRHKVLAVAMATIFVGSGQAKAKAIVNSDICEPYNTFSEAYKEYTLRIKSGDALPDELLDLAEQAYQLGKAKYGQRHQNTYMLEQNLANAYLEAGEYELSAIHYESIIDYHEETQGDDSQSYYFALLDIINLLYTANKAKGFSAENIGLEDYGQHRAIAKLTVITEELVAKMPENSLLFRGHTLRTALSNKWTAKTTQLLNMAKKFHAEALKTLGNESIVSIESLLYIAQINFAMDKTKVALVNFEKVLALLQENGLASQSVAFVAHASLVSIYARKKQMDTAFLHSQEVARNRHWNGNALALHRVDPLFSSDANSNGGGNSSADQSKHDKRRAAVVMMFDIDPQGTAINIRIKESTDPNLEDTAMAALRQWVFAPKFVNGTFITATDFDLNFYL